MNKSATEVSVRTPYKIKGMLGGMRIEMVAPEEIQPVANRRSYLSFFISGKAIVAIVAAAAGTAPQQAAKAEQATVVPMAIPPGSFPNHFSLVWYRSWLIAET